MQKCAGVHWVVVAAILGVPAGCHKESTAAAEHEEIERLPVAVQTARAARATLRPTIELIGTIVADPSRIAMLSARSTAPVAELSVVEGQHVSRDQVVVRLNRDKAE